MEKKKKREVVILSAVAVLTALCIFGIMSGLTLPATDDYQYRLFLKKGFSEFIAMNREHYETYTGRVFVHVLAQIVLAIGMWFFVPVCLVMLTAIPVLAARSTGKGDAPLHVLAVFLPGLLLVPYPVLNQGILWVSSFFNYVFPTALMCLLLVLLQPIAKQEHPGALPILVCALAAFACGATTEQSGLVAIALTGFIFIRALVRKRGRIIAALPLIAAIEGISTIFLSPATTDRVYSETEDAFLSLIRNTVGNLAPVAQRLGSSPLNGVLTASLFLLTLSVLTGPGKRSLSGRTVLIVGAVLTTASLATMLLSGVLLTAVTWVLLVLVGLAAVGLICRGEEIPGLLVLMALLSQAVILPTESDGGRTSTPYFLYLLAAVSILTARRLQGGRPVWRYVYEIALLCAALLCAVPFIGGMVKNYRVDLENRQNIEEARQTGILNYRIDYDYTYTHQKVSITVWRDKFLEGEGLPEDTQMRFYSTERPNVYVNGELFYPAIRDKDKDYICADVVKPLGGYTFYAKEIADAMSFALPWAHCLVEFKTEPPTMTWNAYDGTEGVGEVDHRSADWLEFYPKEVFEDIFGLSITYSEEDMAYYITAPEMEENDDVN